IDQNIRFANHWINRSIHRLGPHLVSISWDPLTHKSTPEESASDPPMPWNLCARSGGQQSTARTIRSNHTYGQQVWPQNPNAVFADNRIRTTKYTIITFLPKNLFEQFHRFANLYFLGIQVLNWIPGLPPLDGHTVFARITAFAKEVQLLPLIFVLGVTAVKDIFEDYRRYMSDKRVNNSVCRVFDPSLVCLRVFNTCVNLFRKSDRFVKTKWEALRVGDIVHLSCDETVPADLLVLSASDDSGLCYVETSNLDGESNLKQRQVIKGYANRGHTFTPNQFTATIVCDPPNHQIYRFNGFITETNGEKIAINKDNLLLRDCILKNTDSIEGIVVYAGHETKAMLNNGGPRYKRSKLERFMNRDVIWCVIILLLMCISGSIGYGLWLSSYDDQRSVVFLNGSETESPVWDAFLIFWTFIVLYQVIIPLSLYVTIELIKLGQIYHIHKDQHLYDETNGKRVFCRALNITEDLGQIEYIFSDKTGTLTENRMVFRRCSIGGIDYSHVRARVGSDTSLCSDDDSNGDFTLNPRLKDELCLMSRRMPSEEETNGSDQKTSYQLSAQNQRIQDFFILLAVCNSAVVSKHPHKCSNSSDKISPLSKKSTESRSPSPTPLKPIYESESPDEVALVIAAFRYSVKLLKRNSESVLLSLPSEGVIEYKVLNILNFDSTRKKMSIILRHQKTNEIILFCKGSDSRFAHMTEEEYNSWNILHKKAEQSIENNEELMLESHNRIECNLVLMGATGIEDSLQERVPEVIANLRSAGIVVWVLTGDKLETAVNIAYSCRLFTNAMDVIYLKIESKEESNRVLENHLKDLKAKGVTKRKSKQKLSKSLSCLLKTALLGARMPERTAVDSNIRNKRGLVVDGKTLSFVIEKESIGLFLELAQFCGSVLCCRATPLQKGSVVRAVKETLNVMTLAIGDGANDVSMIQTADVGI
ncbi:unnamed protein product, partial [Medioppia subpectinata]